MNIKEISEIRRRFRADKTSICQITGVFVNEKKAIISELDQFLGVLPEEEVTSILGNIKKSLSGSIGRNLINIEFSTKQVAESEEHKLLMDLRNSALKDKEILKKFYDKAIESIHMDGNYLILLAHDVYDVFTYHKDGAQETESDQTFTYFVCAVCPVKASHASLTYSIPENKLKSTVEDTIVSAPSLGFMFPTFDGRKTNIYNALYYTKDVKDSQADFVDSIFHAPIPLPAENQKTTFSALMVDTLKDDCNLETVKVLTNELNGIMENNKQIKDDDPLLVTKESAKDLLLNAGVSEAHADEFSKKFEESFGKGVSLPPQNLIASKKADIITPDAHIKVEEASLDHFQTRIIDGVKYLLIPADGDIVVNGVPITITEE